MKIIKLNCYYLPWEISTKCWLESLKGVHNLEDLHVDGSIILK